MSYTPPDPSTYSIPSASRRAVIAVAWLVPSVILYVAIPYYGLRYLDRLGVATGYSLGLLAAAGVVLACLSAAQSFARPTRAYGPLAMAASAGSILYLFLLAHGSTLTIPIGANQQSGSLSLSYAGMLYAFALVPAIRLGAGLITTVEDSLRPGERLPFDYPAKSPPAAPAAAAPPST